MRGVGLVGIAGLVSLVYLFYTNDNFSSALQDGQLNIFPPRYDLNV